MNLAMQFIGAPQFQLDHVPITPSRRAVIALLAYLSVSAIEHPGQRYSRASLASLLWTDYNQTRALTNLRHTLWEITKFIGEGWVMAEHETISLNPTADLDLDVARFQSLRQQAARQSDPGPRIQVLVEAVGLYRDDFLSGFSLKEGPNFNEWANAKAESLRHDFALALDTLVNDYQATDRPAAAIPYTLRRIALDPLNESAHRQLMQIYALTDQHTAAVKQYQSLEKLLRKELNLDPQPETRELYRQIRKGDLKPVTVERQVSRDPPRQKHNLPVHLTNFIGREREQEELRRLLAHNRLVTMIGAGGVGKTRLAIQTAHLLINDFPHGVWFVPLESVSDAKSVPRVVASLLDVVERADQSTLETLVGTLRNKTALLILDNCEHLLDACAHLIETVLKNCPRMRILATSREIFRFEGEISYIVPPLAIPPDRAEEPADQLAAFESVKLFVERARLRLPDFQLTQENAGSIVQICNRLDGIPLAIELAAAHVYFFTLDEILNQLNRSFDLLVSSARSILPRHQTMRASIEWSWNLLTEAERSFMRQLSVFKGGWTLHAAHRIGVKDSLARTSDLWKKSFVVIHQQAGYETRYGFHEVVRSFAEEKLIEAGEEKTMHDRHLNYYLEHLRQLDSSLHTADQKAWLERLFVEHDNIRAALEWAAKTNVEAGLFMAYKLRKFWENYEFRQQARWLLLI